MRACFSWTLIPYSLQPPVLRAKPALGFREPVALTPDNSVSHKGIILAGGLGTRLYPLTRQISKHLLPVFDKPMVYYPLSTLMLAGIRDYLLISTPRYLPGFQQLFGDGNQLGISIDYAAQPEPDGIAQALLIGRRFIGDSRVALILGDNLFYGQGLHDKLQRATEQQDGATVYCYAVNDPRRYGVVSFDQEGNPETLIEKPRRPHSRFAVTGLYFYDPDVVHLASTLRPSSRGELEITDLNRLYLDQGRLHVERFGRGFTCLDMGTETALLHAANFVETIQHRQGLRIACIEEVAYRMGFISSGQLARLAESMTGSYGDYLQSILQDER